MCSRSLADGRRILQDLLSCLPAELSRLIAHWTVDGLAFAGVLRQRNIPWTHAPAAGQFIADLKAFVQSEDEKRPELSLPLLKGPLLPIVEMQLSTDSRTDFRLFDRSVAQLIKSNSELSSTLKRLLSWWCLVDWETYYSEGDIAGTEYQRLLSEKVRTISTRRTNTRSRRQANGVYYTPDHICQQIVSIAKKRFLDSTDSQRYLDPACGSGALLVEVLRQGAFSQAGEALEALYGVDSDPRAVELARRHLWLFRLFQGPDLPSPGLSRLWAKCLVNNIRWGDALWFTDKKEPSPTGAPAVDWSAWVPQGKFHSIIANPPYVFERALKGGRALSQLWAGRHSGVNQKLNTYLLFILLAMERLLPQGSLVCIVPSNHLSVPSQRGFRQYLLENVGDIAWYLHRYRVFEGAEVDTCLMAFTLGGAKTVHLWESEKLGEYRSLVELPAATVIEQGMVSFSAYRHPALAQALAHFESAVVPLQSVASVKAGLKAYEIGKGSPPQTAEMTQGRVFHSEVCKSPEHRPYLKGRDIERYRLSWSGSWLLYGRNLAARRNPALFEGPRILVRQIPGTGSHQLKCAFVDGNQVHDISAMVIHPGPRLPVLLLLALLNSRAVSWWFNGRFDKLQRRHFPQFKVVELKQFPIPQAALESDNIHRLALISLVQERLLLTEPVDHLDKKIDEQVWSLFGFPGGEPDFEQAVQSESA